MFDGRVISLGASCVLLVCEIDLSGLGERAFIKQYSAFWVQRVASRPQRSSPRRGRIHEAGRHYAAAASIASRRRA